MPETVVKFGTDGWRGIIADDFTYDNVRVAARAIAHYVLEHEDPKRGVCVGWDTRFASRAFAEVVAEAAELYARLRDSDDGAYQRLTTRQREVLRLVADGASTKGIAAELKISVKTAEFHRARLMRILGVSGIAGLVRYAIRMGVILP